MMSDSGQTSRWARIRDQIINRTSVGLPRSQRFLGPAVGPPNLGRLAAGGADLAPDGIASAWR